jgi:hypothetical protein
MAEPLVAIEGGLARPSGTVSAEIAAALLGTTPDTLRMWEERFGYPALVSGPNGQRRYSYVTVVALREALDSHASLASAIAVASRAAPGESSGTR